MKPLPGKEVSELKGGWWEPEAPAAAEGPVHEAGAEDLSEWDPRLGCLPISQCPGRPKEEGREKHGAPRPGPLRG